MATLAPAVLRPREAAKYLGLSPSTLAKMRAKGYGGSLPRVPFRKLGSAVVYCVSDLDEYIANLPKGTCDA